MSLDGPASDAASPVAAGVTRLTRLLAVSRPRFWLYLGGPALVGAVWGARTPADVATPVVLGLVAYFLVPANVFLYGVNDRFDAAIDRFNPKKRANGREVRFEGDPLVLAAVVVAGAAALPFVLLLPTVGAVALLGFLALGLEYSAPPFRFKTTPPLDSLSNGLYVLPGVVTYIAVADALPPALAVGGGWAWTMAMHTFSAIPDIAADRRAGVRTTATVLGARRAMAYCVGLWTVATVTMAALAVPLGLLFGLYPALGLLVAAVEVDYERAYWWFPAVNAVAGAVLTLGGLWVLYGW